MSEFAVGLLCGAAGMILVEFFFITIWCLIIAGKDDNE